MDVGTHVLVTGGGGFLGRAIVELLLAQGARVRVLARGSYPDLAARGIEMVGGDLGDAETVHRAVSGCDVVYHVAALAAPWGPYAEFHRINVTGTEHVIAACRAARVRRLIYTSSPSVVFDGTDLEGVDEQVPYPAVHHAHYPATKMLAEQKVLAANCPELCTVALRPHLIWGPGDRHLGPRLIARHRAGRLRIPGNGRNLIDTVYIDNAAEAHLLAAERLQPGSPCAGRAYFITNGDPRPILEIVNGIVTAAGLPPCDRTLPAPIAYGLAWCIEMTWKLLQLRSEPPVTCWVAGEMATAHWFKIDAARRDLGYEPRISLDEGFRRLADWLQEHPL